MRIPVVYCSCAVLINDPLYLMSVVSLRAASVAAVVLDVADGGQLRRWCFFLSEFPAGLC